MGTLPHPLQKKPSTTKLLQMVLELERAVTATEVELAYSANEQERRRLDRVRAEGRTIAARRGEYEAMAMRHSPPAPASGSEEDEGLAQRGD